MAKRINPIVVRKEYTDKTYREFLRSAFALEYESDPRGRSPYFLQVMDPLIVRHIDEIQIDTNEDFKLDIPPIHDDHRNITDYIRTGKTPKEDALFLRYIDAFMQLKVRRFNAAFTQHLETDTTGMVMGEFLRDPSSARSRPQLALNKQSIVGTYEYKDVDTLRQHFGKKRIVVFLSGTNIDYLLMLDFYLNTSAAKIAMQNEELKLVYGFCIPGEEFSPVVMRSVTKHKRHVGLLYTPGNLIDLSGGVFDELTYEVFTTDMEKQGRNSPKSRYSDDPNMAKAMEIHHGPRLKRYLQKVTNPKELVTISKKIDSLRMGLL